MGDFLVRNMVCSENEFYGNDWYNIVEYIEHRHRDERVEMYDRIRRSCFNWTFHVVAAIHERNRGPYLVCGALCVKSATDRI